MRGEKAARAAATARAKGVHARTDARIISRDERAWIGLSVIYVLTFAPVLVHAIVTGAM